MSGENINQVYIANPITSNTSTDLMYFGQSPYGSGNDAAMTYANFAAQFGAPYTPAALTEVSDTNVTLTLGGTPSTALLHAASITAGWTGTLSGTRGGTGVNNGASTITIGGNFAMSGAYTFTGTLTATTAVTFPTSGTLATTSQLPTPAALTEANDTNVTLTLGGTPATSLLQAVSITAGWSGQLSLARGGTNANLTASNGGIFYSTASAGAILAGTATAGQLLTSGASTTPAWTTSTYPATNAANTLLYASSANTMAALATANSSVLVTSAGGVPSLSTTLPNIAIGTPTSGTLTNCTGLPIAGTTGYGTGVATALADNVGSAGAFVINGGALGTPSSGTMTNVSGTASSLTAGQASALVGNTPSYLSASTIGHAVGGSSTNYQMGAPSIPLTQGTWRVKMTPVMNFGASSAGCFVDYLSGFFAADGANNGTAPTAISATTTGPITYNALSSGGTYNPMPSQSATGNYMVFPLECYITVASGTQTVYGVLSVGWVTSTGLLWGCFLEAYKVSN